MPVPVKLQDVVDVLDIISDGFRYFLHKETGSIVGISEEAIFIADAAAENDDLSAYPAWQREEIVDVQKISGNWEQYIELPNKYEINEYSIIEEFCCQVEDETKAEVLLMAIKGRGAFRRFQQLIERYNLEKAWYCFREDALTAVAICWCEENAIEYQK